MSSSQAKYTPLHYSSSSQLPPLASQLPLQRSSWSFDICTFLSELWESGEVLFSSRITWLLLFGPIALVGDLTQWLSEFVCFCFASLALIPCAERLSFVTEQVAMHTNQTFGALLNATFGNAPELLISTAALRAGFYRVVQLTLLGSILTNLLLVFGCACVVGGFRYQIQELRMVSGNVLIGMLYLSTAGLVLPAALKLSNQAMFTSDGEAQAELLFSRVNSLIMMAMYIGYLIFQLHTHKNEFEDSHHQENDEEEDDDLSEEEEDEEEQPNNVVVHVDSKHQQQQQHRRYHSTGGGSQHKKGKKSQQLPPAPPQRRLMRNTEIASSRSLGSKASKKSGKKSSQLSNSRPNSRASSINNGGHNNNNNHDDFSVSSIEMSEFHHRNHGRHMSLTDDDDDEEQQQQHSHLFRRPSESRAQPQSILIATATSATGTEEAISVGSQSVVRKRAPDEKQQHPLDVAPVVNTEQQSLIVTGIVEAVNQVASAPPPVARIKLRNSDGGESMNFDAAHVISEDVQHYLYNEQQHRQPLSDDNDEEEVLMTFRAGIVWLFAITLCISSMSDIIVQTIDGFAFKMRLSEVFTALVVVPFFSNIAEQTSAILFSYRNEMDLCVGITVGSAIQISLFVLPGTVLIGWMVDRSMSLFFQGFETCCLLMGVLSVGAVLQGGTSNWLTGFFCIGVYLMIAAGFWYHQIEDLSIDEETIVASATSSTFDGAANATAAIENAPVTGTP